MSAVPTNDQLDAVLWTQTSIKHDLIYRQVFADATRQLDVALAAFSSVRPSSCSNDDQMWAL
nr:hypothetical protein [Pseudomonas sp. TAE6080]